MHAHSERRPSASFFIATEWLTPKLPAAALRLGIMQIVGACVLFAVMLVRLATSGKAMPAAPVALLSATAAFLFALRAGAAAAAAKSA